MITMQDITNSGTTHSEKEEEINLYQDKKGSLKNDSAEALEEHQWDKHPGGG